MKKKIFISYSSKDKDFIKGLVIELEKFEIEYWLDEWEIQVGDSIVNKIGQGLKDAEYVILVLSKNALNSNWVDREWRTKYYEEVKSNKAMILPALIEDCDIPTLLKEKKYANFKDDFSNSQKFQQSYLPYKKSK